MNVMLRALNIPKIEYNSMKMQATEKEIRKKRNCCWFDYGSHMIKAELTWERLNTFNTERKIS